MKIAMLSVHSCPLGKVGEENTGGMSVYIRELARELGKRNHLVDVYTRAHEPMHDQVVELGENAQLIHLKAGGEEIQKLAVYDHLADFTHALETFRKQKGVRYDLMHSHYWLSGLAGTRIQQWWGIPHIIGFHTLGAVKNAVGIGEDEPELRIAAEKEVVKSCQRIIASTEKGKQDLVRYYDAAPGTVSVIPCGVNLDLFRPINREIARCHLGLNGERFILFVGRIVPLKGIDNLLKAVAYLGRGRKMKLPGHRPGLPGKVSSFDIVPFDPAYKAGFAGHVPVNLVVIGGDEYSQAEMERLKRLSKSLKIHESVFFLGSVKQEVLPFFYSAADLCVVPSHYESFGLVILESLACGTPVVATRVGGAESVIRPGETGYVVTVNDPCCLADKIALSLSTSNVNSAFAGSVRASVTKYGWSNITEAILEEYKSVLGDFRTKACKGTQEVRI